MCRALVGHMEPYWSYLNKSGIRWLEGWQRRAEMSIRRDFGYVDGTLLHYWHGPKEARGYDTRYQIAINNRFDPETDLIRDTQGLWQIHPERIGLRDDLRRYFARRNEDG